MAVSRGSGSSAGEQVVRRPSASKGGRNQRAPSQLAQRIQAAMPSGTTVLSATYLRRDATGRPMYRVRIVPTYAYRKHGAASMNAGYKTISFQGGKVYAPNFKGSGVPAGQGNIDPRKVAGQQISNAGKGSQGVTPLDRAKDKWLSQIASMNIPNVVKQQLTRQIQNFRGSVLGLNAMVEQHLAFRAVSESDLGPQGGGFGFDFGDGGGGGGGGGFSGPEYVAPDRRVVEDMARGMLTSLVGAIDEAEVKRLADLYMADHRRNFDIEDREIDPAQSMLEAIRDTGAYREIHALRPDGEDERTWISQRRAAAQQGGLSTGRLDDFAIEQATIGGDIQDVAQAGAVTQTRESGSTRGTLIEDQIREMSQAFFRSVVV